MCVTLAKNCSFWRHLFRPKINWNAGHFCSGSYWIAYRWNEAIKWTLRNYFDTRACYTLFS